MAEVLAVRIDGLHIADIERRRWNDLRCRYTEVAFDRWPQNTPLLSCSLPLMPGPLRATAFCRGLLAEGRALDAMAGRAGVATDDIFGLLARYGRDVAGAMVLADGRAGHKARTPGAARYEADGLAAAVESLDENPLGLEDDSELSLAGIQNKLLLIRDGDGWARPTGGAPSTHILKAPDLRHPGLLEAEHACLSLAAAAGIAAAETWLEQIGDQPCLIVSRFDRAADAGALRRIHQEDACQALALDPADRRGRAKYQRCGGPSLRQIAALLDRFADDGIGELRRLLVALLFNVLVGNADAHGKNISLLHDPLGATRLAPLYDVVPTVLWPNLRTEAAMTVGGETDIHRITRVDVLAETASWTLPAALAENTIDATCSSVVTALPTIAVEQPALAEQVTTAARRLAPS